MIPKVRRARGRSALALEVLANVRVSPSFARVTLGGAALAGFTAPGPDHAVRLFFPRPGQDGLWLPRFGNDGWMAETLFQPLSRRPWVRTFTVRAHRPARHEIDIEFALHGDAGPASAWAARARPGDPAGIVDEGYTYLPPGGADRQLLVGDESALPAVLSILERAPSHLTGHAFLQVPSAADERKDMHKPSGVRVSWLPRDGGATLPAVLTETADYAWIAGEARLATGVRRHLVTALGMAKQDIAFMGYWRHGRPSLG